ncbi:uncharacterized protein YALI1_E12183g [Yarrowia lipolytica]|uniref:Uncharacterized protein n=1 Tax=Yarrowia lipolytica TaxID=4952 RepID=A0A1D8NHT3_YARLL|nr:hypothetical protein YALI1_E12183g [Yarrowia lipolytica]
MECEIRRNLLSVRLARAPPESTRPDHLDAFSTSSQPKVSRAVIGASILFHKRSGQTLLKTAFRSNYKCDIEGGTSSQISLEPSSMKLTLPGQLWPLRGTISAVGPGISDMIYIDVLHKSSHSELTWGVFWSELECSMSVR